MPGIWPGTWSGQAPVRSYPVSLGLTVSRPSKRELIDTGTDKRYVRRDDRGQIQGIRLRRALPEYGREEAREDRRLLRPGDKGDQKKPKR